MKQLQESKAAEVGRLEQQLTASETVVKQLQRSLVEATRRLRSLASRVATWEAPALPAPFGTHALDDEGLLLTTSPPVQRTDLSC